MRISRIILCAAIMLCFVPAATANAASRLTLTSAGADSFLLQGEAINSAAALECTISYDSTALGNPHVELGALAAGALMAVNTQAAGAIRMALIRTTPITGSGVIASIRFNRAGSGGTGINSLSARLSDIEGRQIPVIVQVVAPSETPPATSVAATQETAAAGRTVSPVVLGIVPVLETKKEAEPETKPVEQTTARPEKDRQQEPAATQIAISKKKDMTPEMQGRKIFTQKSVLDQFREYKQKPGVKAYMDLFKREGIIGFRQEPRIVLSNGRDRIKAIFISTPGNKSASDVAIMGASLVSLRRDPDYTNTWIAEAIPAKGETSAILSVPQGDVLMAFPLTIAPKVNIDLDRSGKVTEEDFKLFLNERGTMKDPKFDLNRDGKRDALDDYIFTANYIASKGL